MPHVVLVVGIELINDVDRLRRHAELRHERIIGDDLFLLQPGLRDQVVKLHAEHDLALVVELGGELLGHRIEILLLVKRLAKELSQFGVNGFRIVVAQKAQAGVDFLLEELSLHPREGREHLDERRQQIRAFGDRARLAHQPAHHPATASPRSGGQKKKPFEPTLSAAGRLLSDNCHRYRLSPGPHLFNDVLQADSIWG